MDGPRDLDPVARALAFSGEHLALLCGNELRRPDALGSLTLAPGARAIAFTMGKDLLVAYPDRLVRVGNHPLQFELPAGFDLRALAIDAGGYWLGGATRVVGYRPAPGDLVVRSEFAVSSPVRALACGPDHAIYALLEDQRLVRDGEFKTRLDAIDLARSGRRLLALTGDAIDDVSDLLATPPEELPDVELPGCDA